MTIACRINNEDFESFTHLILMKPVRTIKVLFGIARGAWIVTPEWIHTSVEQGKPAAEVDFETKHFGGAVSSRMNKEKKGAVFPDLDPFLR